MWYYNARDWLLNHLAIWCMEHCHNWATTFYTACSRITPMEMKCMAKSYLKYKGMDWE